VIERELEQTSNIIRQGILLAHKKHSSLINSLITFDSINKCYEDLKRKKKMVSSSKRRQNKKKIGNADQVGAAKESATSTKDQVDGVNVTKGSVASTKHQTDGVDDATKGSAASTKDQTDGLDDATKGSAASTKDQTDGLDDATRWMLQAATQNKEKSTKISNDDYRTDEGGTPGWNFVEMTEAGKSYLDLPLPRKLTPGIADVN
jgi:hypothetical protein